MNSIMERWIGSCRRELLDQNLTWKPAPPDAVLREYEDHHDEHTGVLASALTKRAPATPASASPTPAT
jgi:putative transposase